MCASCTFFYELQGYFTHLSKALWIQMIPHFFFLFVKNLNHSLYNNVLLCVGLSNKIKEFLTDKMWKHFEGCEFFGRCCRNELWDLVCVNKSKTNWKMKNGKIFISICCLSVQLSSELKQEALKEFDNSLSDKAKTLMKWRLRTYSSWTCMNKAFDMSLYVHAVNVTKGVNAYWCGPLNVNSQNRHAWLTSGGSCLHPCSSPHDRF